MNSQYKKLLQHLESLYPGKYKNIQVRYTSFNRYSFEYTVYVEYGIIKSKVFKTFKSMQEWILAL